MALVLAIHECGFLIDVIMVEIEHPSQAGKPAHSFFDLGLSNYRYRILTSLGNKRQNSHRGVIGQWLVDLC